MGADRASFDGYLCHLEEVGGLCSYELLCAPGTGVDSRGAVPDAVLRLETSVGSTDLHVQLLHSHLSKQGLAHLIAQRGHEEGVSSLLVLAPLISGAMGMRLVEAGFHYLDRAGNCHLEVDGLYVHIEGRSGRRPDVEKGIRRAGYQALFAYLASPGLLDAPLREVGRVAGVSRQAAADMRRRLVEQEYVVETRSRRRWVRREDALQLWLHGYSVAVRPGLHLASLRTRDATPQQLRERLPDVLSAYGLSEFRWGGTTAAFELVGHHRGESTTIHLPPGIAVPPGLRRGLEALVDPRGNLVLMSSFGTAAWLGTETTVHPLLVYSELLRLGERAQEAATLLYTRLLTPLWDER